MSILLARTGQPDLMFRGTKLAEADSRDLADPKAARWFEARVYQADPGPADPMFVAQVCFETEKPGEFRWSRASWHADREAIRAYIRSQNPVGYLRRTLLKHMPEDRREAFAARMVASYQECVRRLYERLGPEWAASPQTDAEPPEWHVASGDSVLTVHGSWARAAGFLGDRRDLVAFRSEAEARAACRVLAVLYPYAEAAYEPFRYD